MKIISKSKYDKITDRCYAEFLCEYCNKILKLPTYRGKRKNSCGCMNYKLKEKKYNFRIMKLYNVWKTMKERCRNKNTYMYYRYGGRGIDVCEEWKNNYMIFQNWALNNGYKDGLTIDRINNDGNYNPDNCQFLTNKENIRKKSNINIDIANKIRIMYSTGDYTQSELGKMYNLKQANISCIIRNKYWM